MSSFLKGLYIRYLANAMKLKNIVLVLGGIVVLCIVFTGALYIGQFVYNLLSIHIETLNVQSNTVSISQNYALSRFSALFGAVVAVMCYFMFTCYFILIIAFFNYKKNYNTVVNWVKSTSAYSKK